MTIVPPRSAARIRLHRRPLALCLAAVLAAPLPALASTITVTTCADSGAGSLRDAVATAISGDTIDFDAGLGCSTISLTSGAITIANGADGQPLANLTIEGPGRNALTIDGGYADRVLIDTAFEPGLSSTLTISGLKVQHGLTNGDGGCIYTSGGIDLSDVEVSECMAGIGATASGGVRGGGISVGGDATLASSFVGDNKVDGGVGSAYGAGLFVGGNAHLDASTVSGNFATATTGVSYGGGIAVGRRDLGTLGTLHVYSSDIQNNTAFSHCSYCPVRGGGAFVYGLAAVGASAISGNTAFSDWHYGAGGGLYFRSGPDSPPVSARLIDTDLGSNTADEDGGAIGANGDLTVTRGTISGNSAKDGGAILVLSGYTSLVDSLLTGNIAMDRGGAIFVHGYCDAAAENTTISENLAQGNGGAIANSYGTVHLSNATITANTANGLGGGIWFDYAYYTLALESTIIAGNTANGNPDDIFAPGGTVTGSHDLIGAALSLDMPPDTLHDDPLLLPLADNGGPTMTHALAEGSPAIDAGDNPFGFATDQRGVGFARVSNGAADIGAFEVQAPPPDDRIFANGFDP
ncbi:MAG TPA: choice-of-anchor Q domain-containing protein [Rhodanobacteraceae bacterium]|nr:choice-of-anchor Q domain-containing protein [Rhodanobacteraceae bacterium]